MNMYDVLIGSVSGDSEGFAANGVEVCRLISQVGFIDDYGLVSIHGNYRHPQRSSHLKTHVSVVIRVEGVEQEMCVCRGVCGRSKNTGDIPAPSKS